MRFAPWALAAVLLAAVPAPSASPDPADEELLLAAGLGSDGPALVAFFRIRAHAEASPGRLRQLLRQLAEAPDQGRRQAEAELIAWGPLAVPALRRAANDLNDPILVERARRCLRWLDGPSSASLSADAARLIAIRQPEGAAETLLAYLPFADDAEVAREVRAALATVAFPGGKPDPALLRGLADPEPACRAAAGAALCRADRPEQFPTVRKLLDDPRPGVRLQAALALARARDPEAIPVLIAALADVSAEQRKQAEEFLHELAGEWAPAANFPGEDEIALRTRRDAWAAWWRNADGPALLAAVRKRTLSDADRARARTLIRGLGDESFSTREQAAADLAALGHKALPLLREALDNKDLEIARRAEECIRRIEHEPAHHLPAAAVRLLALRRPEGAAEALLAYLPFAEDDSLADETRTALTQLALRDGKPDASLERALADPAPLLRAAAAEALARGGGVAARPAVRKLLADPDPSVRLRTALTLAAARDREAVPVLIELVGVLKDDLAGQAEEPLYQLAGDRAPELPADEDPKEARKKRHDAWAVWWKEHGEHVDLARIDSTRSWLGCTVIAESNNGRVLELGRDGKPRWTIQGVSFPVDAVVLPGNRVLIAEYNGRRVTERDFKGNILWQKANLPGQPVNVQRLPNGHTFIATDAQLLEVDRAGKEVFVINNLGPITAGYRAPRGNVICLTQNGRCVRLDTTGKEIKSFPSNRNGGWTGGLDLLPGGRILITQPNRNKVSEFDADGRLLHEYDAPQVTTATALPNGRILAASVNTQRAFEIDRQGKVVWEHKGEGNVFRARRR
jgi:HEAT repeat protein